MGKNVKSVDDKIKLNTTFLEFLNQMYQLKAYEKINNVCVIIPELDSTTF